METTTSDYSGVTKDGEQVPPYGQSNSHVGELYKDCIGVLEY
jgi:hypothetical protein